MRPLIGAYKLQNEKIAIVADVHANIYALEAFLEHIRELEITQIWNLGDFLQVGPHPREVADAEYLMKMQQLI